MQMYRVRFARKLPNDIVDIGDCVICAATADSARDGVAAVLFFPISTAEFEIIRVKPSLYLIKREKINKSLSSAQAKIVDADEAVTGTFPGVTESMLDEHWFETAASAHIKAENEEAAISKLARGIIREMNGEKQRSSTRELEIKCDRKELRPRTPATEENALYTHLRFFEGGSARGK
jgi:hypothetical protein